MYNDTIEITRERRFLCFRWTQKVRVPVAAVATTWMNDAEREYHCGGGFARG